jgi:hypothetical protein
MKKHNVDTSCMIVSTEDQQWANGLVFGADSLEFKNTLDAHYLQYFPPHEKKLNEKIASINFLDLKKQKNLEILDISTGCGHFLVLAQALGHSCQGTEISESINLLTPLYEHYNLDVFPLYIEKQKEIKLSKKYDLIKSGRTVFDSGWKSRDWTFLKENLMDFLLPGGRIFIKTNIKFIPNNVRDASRALGDPIIGWNSLTYLIEK